MVKRFLTTLIVMVASSLSLLAQTSTQTQDFVVGFNGIQADNAFEISLREGASPSVTWTVDSALKDYVEVYVKSKILYLHFNQKGMSSELKKTYRGKNAPKMTLKVVVTTNQLESLSLSDNVVFDGSGLSLYGEGFALTASGSAKVSNLNLTTSSASVSLSKSAVANLKLEAEHDITVKAANSAVLTLTSLCAGLNVTASNSSAISAAVTGADNVSITSSNSATVVLTGDSSKFAVTGSGSSEIDASACRVSMAEVNMSNSSKLKVNSQDELKVTIKGATVNFGGDPKISVASIVNGTLTRL